MKKPFLLFTWSDYYPSGGFNDLRACCATLEEAMSPDHSLHENSEIYELLDCDIVCVATKSYSEEWKMVKAFKPV